MNRPDDFPQSQQQLPPYYVNNNNNVPSNIVITPRDSNVQGYVCYDNPPAYGYVDQSSVEYTSQPLPPQQYYTSDPGAFCQRHEKRKRNEALEQIGASLQPFQKQSNALSTASSGSRYAAFNNPAANVTGLAAYHNNLALVGGSARRSQQQQNEYGTLSSESSSGTSANLPELDSTKTSFLLEQLENMGFNHDAAYFALRLAQFNLSGACKILLALEDKQYVYKDGCGLRKTSVNRQNSYDDSHNSGSRSESPMPIGRQHPLGSNSTITASTSTVDYGVNAVSENIVYVGGTHARGALYAGAPPQYDDVVPDVVGYQINGAVAPSGTGPPPGATWTGSSGGAVEMTETFPYTQAILSNLNNSRQHRQGHMMPVERLDIAQHQQLVPDTLPPPQMRLVSQYDPRTAVLNTNNAVARRVSSAAAVISPKSPLSSAVRPMQGATTASQLQQQYPDVQYGIAEPLLNQQYQQQPQQPIQKTALYRATSSKKPAPQPPVLNPPGRPMQPPAHGRQFDSGISDSPCISHDVIVPSDSNNNNQTSSSLVASPSPLQNHQTGAVASRHVFKAKLAPSQYHIAGPAQHEFKLNVRGSRRPDGTLDAMNYDLVVPDGQRMTSTMRIDQQPHQQQPNTIIAQQQRSPMHHHQPLPHDNRMATTPDLAPPEPLSISSPSGSNRLSTASGNTRDSVLREMCRKAEQLLINKRDSTSSNELQIGSTINYDLAGLSPSTRVTASPGVACLTVNDTSPVPSDLPPDQRYQALTKPMVGGRASPASSISTEASSVTEEPGGGSTVTRSYSPLPVDVKERVDKGESTVSRILPRAFCFYMEQHVENVVKYYNERQRRQMQFEKELQGMLVGQPQLQNGLRVFMREKESRHLRLKRQKLHKDMFIKLQNIGSGAFGEVALVRKQDTKTLFAMKTLKKREVIKKNQAAHVKAERDILSEADSEWVVKLYYSFQDRDNLFFIMEYIPGGDLMNLLIKLELFTPPLARFYIAELVCAIESVHKLKFIHRDIKPDNILIDQSGHIKLTDFGLCTGLRWTHESKYYKEAALGINHGPQDSFDLFTRRASNTNVTTQKTKLLDFRNSKQRIIAHSLVGTPNYIAPEVLTQEGHTCVCDWWSVGVILYEMLVGCPPFHADKPEETQRKIVHWKDYLQIPEYRPLNAGAMPEDAAHLIRSLCRDKQNRLGCGGADTIKAHQFFNGVSWDDLRTTTAPYIPTIEHEEDTSNFDPVSPRPENDPPFGTIERAVSDHAFYEFTFRRFFLADGYGCPTVRSSVSSIGRLNSRQQQQQNTPLSAIEELGLSEPPSAQRRNRPRPKRTPSRGRVSEETFLSQVETSGQAGSRAPIVESRLPMSNNNNKLNDGGGDHAVFQVNTGVIDNNDVVNGVSV